MQAARPGLAVRTAPYLSARLARAIGFLQSAMATVAVVTALELLVGWAVVPAVLGGRTTAAALPFVLLALFLAMQVAGASATSGAFEVVDEESGVVVYSKLARGRMPRTPDDLLSLVDAAAPPARKVAADAPAATALPPAGSADSDE